VTRVDRARAVRTRAASGLGGERGAALFAALLVLVVLLGASAVFLLVGQARFLGSTEIVSATEATLYAESAVALRAHEINSGAVSQTDLDNNTVPGKVIKAGDRSATIFVDSRGYPRRVFLGATARAREGRAAIEVMLARRTRSLFGGFGLAARFGLTLQKDIFLDSYSSEVGPYAVSAGANGDIGSEAGTITVGSNVEIRGSLRAGSTPAIQDPGTFTLTGEMVTDAPPSFPLLDAEIDRIHATVSSVNDNAKLLAAIAAAGGGWQLSGGVLSSKKDAGKLVVPPGSYWLRGIDVNMGSEIEFGPGETTLAVDGGIFMKHDGAMAFGSGATIKTYIKNGDMHVQHHVDIATAITPNQFQVYGHSNVGKLHLQPRSAIHGAFYWPGGEVHIQHGVELYGGVIGENVFAQHGTRFHYDEGLRALDREGSFGLYGYRKTAQD